MNIISVREIPSYKEKAISYIQSKWASQASLMVYEDCISNCIATTNPLPQWYLLELDGDIIGCAGLITNDFISRMDLYPWLCALYIEEKYRGIGLSRVLIDHVKKETKRGGFSHLYLCTDHIGYYEKLGFSFVGMGYHPWGASSRIYSIII